MPANEAIILKTYDLLKAALLIVGKFPRDQRFLLGDRIEVKLLDILELLISAYYSVRAEKPAQLRKANIMLEQMRYLVRLAHDLHLMNHEKYGSLSESIDEVGKMCGGWLKAVS